AEQDREDVITERQRFHEESLRHCLARKEKIGLTRPGYTRGVYSATDLLESPIDYTRSTQAWERLISLAVQSSDEKQVAQSMWEFASLMIEITAEEMIEIEDEGGKVEYGV